MELPTRQVDRQDWNQLEESTLQRHLQESLVHGWCSQPWDCLGSQGGEEGEEGEEGQRLKKENQQPRLTAKPEENPAALGLLEAKRNRKHAAGPSAAKRSSQVRMENCPLGLATRRSRVTVTPEVTTERWGRKPGGCKRPRGKVIESRDSARLSRILLQRGAKEREGSQ